MWVTRRKTKRAKAVHTKKLFFRLACGFVGLFVIGIGLYVYFSYFFTSDLLRPVPAMVQAANSSDEQLAIQEIQQKLYAAHITTDQVSRAEDGNYRAKIADNGEVILSQSRNISLQIASLQVILERLTMEGRRFAKLDLRFDKPVIVF